MTVPKKAKAPVTIVPATTKKPEMPWLMRMLPRDKTPHANPPEWQLCEACGIRRWAHVHHKEHKAMGGRHGAAKIASEDPKNKIKLCTTCHAASHFEHEIAPDGFHCGSCRWLERCYYGRITMGESKAGVERAGISPRW